MGYTKWRPVRGMVRSPGMCSFLDFQRATTRCAVRFYSGHVATYEYCDRHAAQVEATDKGSNIAERSFEIRDA